MPLRETAPRRERADPDRRFGFLGNAHHQLDRLGAIDRRTNDERGVLSCRKCRDKRLHRLGRRRKFTADGPRLDRFGRVAPVIDRHRDEGRSAGRLHGNVVGARDRGRHVFGARGLDAEFDVGPRKFRGAFGIKERLQRQDAACLLAGGDHQRGLVAVGGIDIAERVADTGRRMQIDEAGVAGGLRVTIGHADHRRFLQAKHIVDIVGPIAEERQFGRAGIAEHLGDTERAQQVERGLFHRDGFSASSGLPAGQCFRPFVFWRVIPGQSAGPNPE